MERSRFGSSNGGSATKPPPPPPRQPNYTSPQVQEALEHLASIDPIDLCNEAKVEQCRATRDLRSCGRHVQSVLVSCGHASLCEECSQRCDVCPICRIPLPKDGNRLRLRLYYECSEARLISIRCDDSLQDKEVGEKHLVADVERLYSLFDVALDNNLVSLICHYVTDVCMDESAVSSDPVTAFLLDEVVVKDWCKRTFKQILSELHLIYNLRVQEMDEHLSSLLKFSVKLTGMSNILEILELSFKGSLSAKFTDLRSLQEGILKTKQHLEIMAWCIKHGFLENVRSRHPTSMEWRSRFRERKSAAISRAWPSEHCVAESDKPDCCTLFIEDALSNIEMQIHTDDHEDELEIALLHKDGGLLYSRSKLEGMAGCYPFENLRAATDLLFLGGSSDLLLAKQAILLYYLIDRHWTISDESWRSTIDDFAATFSITRHFLLESFVFYLLDDHTDEALQVACHLLPEIAGPNTHSKVAQVLLERQNPDAALMVLRWSGRDGGAQLVSLWEAVTAVRVRVECGLLTEAFMYQRMVCTKIKDKNFSDEPSANALDERKDESWSWAIWVETLVTEICRLCIRRNLVDRIIELPWDSDEEKHLHKCLLDFATMDPSTAIGSLLVVFYLQRYRYVEAYQVDRKLQTVEEEFISKSSLSDEVSSKLRSTTRLRAGLVDKSIEVLPDVIQKQVKTGTLAEVESPGNGVDVAKSDVRKVQEPILTSLLATLSNPPTVEHRFTTSSGSAVDSPLSHRIDNTLFSSKPSVLEFPLGPGGAANASGFKSGNHRSPVPVPNFFNFAGKGPKDDRGLIKSFKFDDTMTPYSRRVSPPTASPQRELGKSSSRVPRKSHLHDQRAYKISPEIARSNGLINQIRNSGEKASGFAMSFGDYNDLIKDSSETLSVHASGKGTSGQEAAKPRMLPSNDSMDISWSPEERGLSAEDRTINGGPRWRSDDSSDDEDRASNVLGGFASYKTTHKGVRRSRFSRR